jgi:hypothetical protein
MSKTQKARTTHLTVAQLAKKHDALERRIAAFEKKHTFVLDTIIQKIDDFTEKMKQLVVHQSIGRRSDERVEKALTGLMPYLSSMYDASESKRHKH